MLGVNGIKTMAYAHKSINPKAPNAASPLAAWAILTRVLKLGSIAVLKKATS